MWQRPSSLSLSAANPVQRAAITVFAYDCSSLDVRNPDRPLFDRPLMATYPPGSVFKLVNELVAMQLGVVGPNTGFECNQKLVHCTHRHEYPANLNIAIKNSCNPYFYQVMRAAVVRHQSPNGFEDARLGLGQWQKMVKSFGLG